MEAQQFSAQPRPAESKAMYRQDESNIMSDRRVVRGNTYAALVLPREDPAEVDKIREAQRRRLMRADRTRKRAGTPEPVLGRKHTDVQTDSYLEELTERTVEFEAEAQTDFLLDRPQSPLFMVAKIGVDISTQVEHGELFDFDREVEPVLEVLIGKTLEQGMMEVLEEEELASIRKRQGLFEQTRHAELLDVQRMEAAEKRREEEKGRRLAQAKADAEQEFVAFKKAQSRAMARSYMGGIGRKCLDSLEAQGLFTDQVQVSVESEFMPYLVSTVAQEIQNSADRQQMLAQAMENICDKLAAPRRARLTAERKRKAAVAHCEFKIRKNDMMRKRMEAAEKARLEREAKAIKEFDEYEEPEEEKPIIIKTTAGFVVETEGPATISVINQGVLYPTEDDNEIAYIYDEAVATTLKEKLGEEEEGVERVAPAINLVCEMKNADAVGGEPFEGERIVVVSIQEAVAEEAEGVEA